MTPLGAALRYAAQRGWPVFPCHANGERRKRPHVEGGFHTASRDPRIVGAWWGRWPDALIGLPTGQVTGIVVLDIDVKADRANGYDSLDDLGHSILPGTWIALTASGGLHAYFNRGEREFRNSAGKLGPGLDVRGDGGYVILPAPGSGYSWDAHWNPETSTLAPAPGWLIPPVPERPAATRPVEPARGLSAYAEAAVDSAARRIIGAPSGQQETTLNAKSFAIGTLAGAGAIPAAFALQALIWAAHQMPNHDPRRPWRAGELEVRVERAFAQGLRHPREVANG